MKDEGCGNIGRNLLGNMGYVESYMRGEINIDDFVTHTMKIDDINHALELMHEGKSIRSVLTF